MSENPQDEKRMLEQARAKFQDIHEVPSEAVGICFDILTLFPGNTKAAELILEGLSQPAIIRNYRKAISRLIDEWDDRPWQQRRRRALSFNYLSGQHLRELAIEEDEKPDETIHDVQDWLTQGDKQLAQAYFSGIERATEVAWAIFQEAIRRAHNFRGASLWIANHYAQKGFFGEAMDVLDSTRARFPEDQELRRFWIEIRWWRDHQHLIPWIPPDGDGQLYERYLGKYDPERLAFEKNATPLSRQYRPPDLSKFPSDFIFPEPLPDVVETHLSQIIKNAPTLPTQTVLDWSYLKQLVSDTIDISKFPKWAQELLQDVQDPELRAAYAADFFARFSDPEFLEDDDLYGD